MSVSFSLNLFFGDSDSVLFSSDVCVLHWILQTRQSVINSITNLNIYLASCTWIPHFTYTFLVLNFEWLMIPNAHLHSNVLSQLFMQSIYNPTKQMFVILAISFDSFKLFQRIHQYIKILFCLPAQKITTTLYAFTFYAITLETS